MEFGSYFYESLECHLSFTVVFSVTFSLLRENIEMHFGKKHLFWKLYLFKTQHDSC